MILFDDQTLDAISRLNDKFNDYLADYRFKGHLERRADQAIAATHFFADAICNTCGSRVSAKNTVSDLGMVQSVLNNVVVTMIEDLITHPDLRQEVEKHAEACSPMPNPLQVKGLNTFNRNPEELRLPDLKAIWDESKKASAQKEKSSTTARDRHRAKRTNT